MARAGNTYTCPQCGEESIHPVTCHRCDVLPVDERGFPPPPLFEREILFRKPADPVHSSKEGNPGAELAAIGGYTFTSLARQIREMIRRRRFCAVFKHDVTPIAAAEGRVHVRGRVEVLEPVMHRHGDPVAAYLFRIRESSRKGDTAVETQLACGKFLVRDESGVALVDDDFFTIVPKDREPFPASGNVDVRIQEGDEVQIVGPTERRALPDLPSVGRAGFRDAPKILVFDGAPNDLVVIRPV